MLKIVNLRNYEKKENEVLVRVDRSSVLGNPFRMQSEAERDEVIEKYEEYFEKKVKIEGTFRNEVIRIYRLAKEKDVALGCWCYPKKCHAEVIAEFLKKFL